MMQRFQIVQTPRSELKINPELSHNGETKSDSSALRRVNAVFEKKVPSGLGTVLMKNPLKKSALHGGTRSKVRGAFVPTLPPNLNRYQQVYPIRLRFEALSTVAQVQIKPYMLLGACGTICIAAGSLASCIASSVRLRRLTIWPASQGEASVYWAAQTGGLFGAPDLVTDESIPTGITVTKPLSVTPPAGSPASMWNTPTSGATTVTCDITVTQGSIIDVDLDYTMNVNITPLQLSIGASTLGAMYYLYLDGQTSHSLKPIGRPNV